MPLSFSAKLIRWYKKEARDLPWRRTRDPYCVWISEVMLQQTTVATVIPRYQRWMKLFPTLNHVAQTPLPKILKSWQGLGYYARARNIHRSAKLMCEKGGRFPESPEGLRALPGFGPYTVGAVLSIAFDQRQPIVDANVRRVGMRLLGIKGYADVSQDKKIFCFLDKVMPQKDLRSFNQALMELGALVCRPREVLCTQCPVKDYCVACKKGIQEVIPEPRKQETKEIHVSVGVIEQGSKYLIQQRPAQGLLANLWEFPGGKIEAGETPVQALHRELKEEIHVSVHNVRPLTKVRHYYTQFLAHLHVFLCQCNPGQTLLPSRTRKWVSLKEMTKYAMPSGSARILEHLNNLHGSKLLDNKRFM
ncbi:MAG: A/G-specific adenine glycosylase [Candidatus Omnitrophota bacterium]|nr:A/G-specific adenine glycosylase [Candidatus Omnitrophota bacterium]